MARKTHGFSHQIGFPSKFRRRFPCRRSNYRQFRIADFFKQPIPRRGIHVCPSSKLNEERSCFCRSSPFVEVPRMKLAHISKTSTLCFAASSIDQRLDRRTVQNHRRAVEQRAVNQPGPIIQPMSVTQEMRVPRPTSVPKAISCAALTGNPQ